METCPPRPWSIVVGVVTPVEGRRALLRSWWSDVGHCSLSYSSKEMIVTVTGVNSSHASFYCKAIPHGERSKVLQ